MGEGPDLRANPEPPAGVFWAKRNPLFLGLAGAFRPMRVIGVRIGRVVMIVVVIVAVVMMVAV